jgi:hypothetical protein
VGDSADKVGYDGQHLLDISAHPKDRSGDMQKGAAAAAIAFVQGSVAWCHLDRQIQRKRQLMMFGV